MKQRGADRLVQVTRRACLAATALLAILATFPGWQTGNGSLSRAVAAAMLLPLLLPLPGMLRGTRRTFAWGTLCVIPCFVYGLTETIANPAARPVAALILLVSLMLFVLLIAHLRVTRPAAVQTAAAD